MIYIYFGYIYIFMYNTRWRSVAVTTKLLWFPCGQIIHEKNVAFLVVKVGMVCLGNFVA